MNETMVINGVIYTVEGSHWENNPADSMLIDEAGIIRYVGNEGEARSLARNAKIIDLQGKTVLPGFIDAHVHVPGTELMELYDLDLNGTSTKKETMECVKTYIHNHPDFESYFGSGFNMSMIDEHGKAPCAKWLDDICPDKPMVIRSSDMHSRWVNTAAMKASGVTRDTISKGIGHIHRDPEGNPTGLFTDTRDIRFVEPTYNVQQQEEGLKRFIKRMNAWGYTSIMAIPPTPYIQMERYMQFENQGILTLKINCGVLIDQNTFEKNIEELRNLKEQIQSPLIKVTTAKLMIDGVVEGETAYLKEPYASNSKSNASYRGKLNWKEDTLKEVVRKLGEQELQVHMHCVGDAATTAALDAIEHAHSINESKDHRSVITHLQLVDDEDKNRMGRLGVIGAIQPFWHIKEPGFFENIEKKALGAQRAEREYPARSLADQGVILTASGDYPVSPINNPFLGIEAGVTRNLYNSECFGFEPDDSEDPRYLLNKEERLTLPEMIEAYTINGAYQLFREKETGSLSQGKMADFIVLSQDPFKVNLVDIDKIKVLATVLNGTIVHGTYGGIK